MNNKGISEVIAIVLIVLITVAAVTIVWQVVIPLVYESTSGVGDCVSAANEVVITGVCLNDTNSKIKFKVSYGSRDVGLSGIDIIAYDKNGNSKTFSIDEDLPGPNEEKILETEDVTEVGQGGETIEFTEGYAYALRVGDKTCTASGKQTLPKC